MTSIRQGVLPFKLEVMERDDCLTSFGGLPLVIECYRRIGLPDLVSKKLKLKSKGWTENTLMEALIALAVVGGEHMEDWSILQADKAYQGLVGYDKDLPSVKAVERFLKLFHDEDLMQKRPSRDKESAWVPKESRALQRLGEINDHVVTGLIRAKALKTVTIENDATVVLSDKRECLGTYKGGTGYLPVVATVAELGMVLCDEFRDGNVAPGYKVKAFFAKCLKKIPKEVKQIRARLDGAYYEHGLMKYMDKQGVQFSITADKSIGIMRWIKALPEESWKPLTKITDRGVVETEREWAELEWTSAEGTRKTIQQRTRRYIVTRKKTHQWELFQQTTLFDVVEKDRYSVIVTNMDWQADRLIHWHNERAGSIEHTIDRVKNDLGGSVLPCAQFGANAAWWRIQCIAHNLIRALQIHAFPEELSTCKFKKLRLWLFCIAGRVVRTGRQLILKLIGNHPAYEIYKEARLKVLHWAVP